MWFSNCANRLILLHVTHVLPFRGIVLLRRDAKSRWLDSVFLGKLIGVAFVTNTGAWPFGPFVHGVRWTQTACRLFVLSILVVSGSRAPHLHRFVNRIAVWKQWPNGCTGLLVHYRWVYIIREQLHGVVSKKEGMTVICISHDGERSSAQSISYHHSCGQR